MLLAKINTQLCVRTSSLVRCSRRSESVISSVQEEANENIPVYPLIEDVSHRGRFRKRKEVWAKEVQNIQTVEEKMIKLNIPKYWGFSCMMYEEDKISYNELSQAQFITRTHLASNVALPSYYDNIIPPEKLNELTKKIKGLLQDGIAFELTQQNHNRKILDDHPETQRVIDDANSDAVSRQVNRIILSSLAKEYPHLLSMQTDCDPRIEAFWFTGGFIKPEKAMKTMEKCGMHEIMHEPQDRAMQYLGKPSLHLRHQLPLKEILPLSECEDPKLEVPIVKYDPRTLGHCTKRRHGTTIPGFWPGDSFKFGFLSYHRRGYLFTRPKGVDDDVAALTTQSILANYAWLLGQASHLGFTTYNDVTYPLVNQSIITNGQSWSFCVYQLNTTLVNSWNSELNPKRNICWITEPLKLYDTMVGGELIGFNDEVLKNLIKFYVNEPQERIGVNMIPYLNSKKSTIAKIRHDQKRMWLEELYKRLMCNRPRHGLIPEIYQWERIYKHMFKTRPLDKRRTPWDFGINPFRRRLDQPARKYIPKALRKSDKSEKFELTYFPK